MTYCLRDYAQPSEPSRIPPKLLGRDPLLSIQSEKSPHQTLERLDEAKLGARRLPMHRHALDAGLAIGDTL